MRPLILPRCGVGVLEVCSHAGAQSGSRLLAQEAVRAGVWRPEAGGPVSGRDDERSSKLGYGAGREEGGARCVLGPEGQEGGFCKSLRARWGGLCVCVSVCV